MERDSKKQKLSDEPDEKVLATLSQIEDLQNDLEKVNEEASDKILEIEQKYNKIRRPVYKKRQDLIKKVPSFWLRVFQNHHTISCFLVEDDHEILSFVENVDVEDFEDVKSGFTITFEFRKNPFLSDERLVRTFNFSQEGTVSITGTKISWKKREGETEGGKDKARDSFLQWFEQELEGETLEDTDGIAETMKDDVWPNALKYYMMEGDDEDEEEEEEDDDEDEDEDEDEDADEEDE